MPKSGQPQQELAELDRRIAEAEMRITRMAALMDRRSRDGRDTTAVHALLNEMKGGLAGMYAHRQCCCADASFGGGKKWFSSSF
jgi:hypothetical protein